MTEEKDSSPSLAFHRLLGHLAAFYYATREGSIQGAARKLGLNRNSLSRYLEELEAHMGVSLRHLDSETRGLDLTEAGRHLQQLLEPVFSRLETVAAEVTGGMQDLRLGCQTSTSTYLLPHWLRAFEREAFDTEGREPGLRLSLKTGSSESILQALIGLEVDLGIIATDVDREQVEDGIAYVPLVRERLFAICPRRHPFAERASVPAREFVRHPQYLYYRGGERYQERINALAPGEGARRQMEFDTIQAIKETVRAGLGVSIVPGGVVRNEDMEWMGIVPLDVPPDLAPRLTRSIAAVTREGDELTPLAREFLEFMSRRRKGLIEPH